METCALSVRKRLSPSLIRVRLPHLDFRKGTCSLSDYIETCVLSVRERLAPSLIRVRPPHSDLHA